MRSTAMTANDHRQKDGQKRGYGRRDLLVNYSWAKGTLDFITMEGIAK